MAQLLSKLFGKIMSNSAHGIFSIIALLLFDISQSLRDVTINLNVVTEIVKSHQKELDYRRAIMNKNTAKAIEHDIILKKLEAYHSK